MSIYEVKTLFDKNLNNILICDDGKNKIYLTLSTIIDKYNEYGLITGEEYTFIYRNISYIIKFNKTICGFIFINVDESEYSIYDVYGGIKYNNTNMIGFSTNTKNDIKIYKIIDIININDHFINRTLKLPDFIHNECHKIIDQYLLFN